MISTTFFFAKCRFLLDIVLSQEQNSYIAATNPRNRRLPVSNNLPIPTSADQLAYNIRHRVLAKLGRMFKCSPAKAEERMQRLTAKYAPYRVAFSNLVDEDITSIFTRMDAGVLPIAIKPAHWAAVDGSESQRAFCAVLHGGKPGTVQNGPSAQVCYWMPHSTSNNGAAA